MGTPFKMKAGKEGPMRKNFPAAFKTDDVKGNKKAEAKIGGTTFVGPFTENELKGAEKANKSGKKGYLGTRSGVTDNDMKSFYKIYGEGANPNLKPYGMSFKEER